MSSSINECGKVIERYWDKPEFLKWLKSLRLRYDYSLSIDETKVITDENRILTPSYLDKIGIKDHTDRMAIMAAFSMKPKDKNSCCVNNAVIPSRVVSLENFLQSKSLKKSKLVCYKCLNQFEVPFREPKCAHCPRCGLFINNDFSFAQKNKKPMMECPKCGVFCHVASSRCVACDHSFPKAAKLSHKAKNRHGLVHPGFPPNEKLFDCKLCGKRFGKPSVLKRHMKVHTGEKPFACSYCERCFAHNQDKQRHEMGHTGERPFSCHVCGKGFIRSSSLNKHMASHSNSEASKLGLAVEGGIFGDTGSTFKKQIKKKFQCNLCFKSFDRRQNLVHHIRVHTGEKPHSCTVCFKKFTQEYHLKRHMKTHARTDPLFTSFAKEGYSGDLETLNSLEDLSKDAGYSCEEYYGDMKFCKFE